MKDKKKRTRNLFVCPVLDQSRERPTKARVEHDTEGPPNISSVDNADQFQSGEAVGAL